MCGGGGAVPDGSRAVCGGGGRKEAMATAALNAAVAAAVATNREEERRCVMTEGEEAMVKLHDRIGGKSVQEGKLPLSKRELGLSLEDPLNLFHLYEICSRHFFAQTYDRFFYRYGICWTCSNERSVRVVYTCGYILLLIWRVYKLHFLNLIYSHVPQQREVPSSCSTRQNMDHNSTRASYFVFAPALAKTQVGQCPEKTKEADGDGFHHAFFFRE